MVVGIDIDETITRHSAFFKFLTGALIDADHTVIIITFRDDPVDTQGLLKNHEISYSKLVTSSLEAHLEHGVDQWKAWVCKEYKVEILFDDSPETLRYIDGNITSFMVVDQNRYDLNKLLT